MATRMFMIVLFISRLSIGVLAQGVFDPPAFTQSSCTGSNQWTVWLDSGDPNLTQGEFEMTTLLLQKFPAFMCSAPIAIEVSFDLFFWFFIYFSYF